MKATAPYAQPSLTQLNQLIDKVPNYPVSVRSLLKLAKISKQPKEVVNFYQDFGKDMVFDDQDDLKERTEQVEIMREEGRDMPPEQLRAPEEY
jgi:hypothetical protein